MFCELAAETRSKLASAVAHAMAEGREVIASISNDVTRQTTTCAARGGSWTAAAVLSSLEVAVELIEEGCIQRTPASCIPRLSQRPAQLDSDVVVFPCRNAAEVLSGLVSTKSISGLTAAARATAFYRATAAQLTSVASASSIHSAGAELHQQSVARIANAQRLPTIASVVENAVDRRRYLFVMTPFDPNRVPPTAVLTQQHKLQQQRMALHADPTYNTSIHHISAIAANQSGLLDRNMPGSPQRLHDSHTDVASLAAKIDDSGASSYLNADDRPEGLAYTLSVCEVSQRAQHVVVSFDGRWVMVLQRDSWLDVAPLVVDTTTSRLDVVTCKWAPSRPSHATIAWAAAVALNTRICVKPSSAERVCDRIAFACILSDGSCRTMVGILGVPQHPGESVLFSPSERASGATHADSTGMTLHTIADVSVFFAGHSAQSSSGGALAELRQEAQQSSRGAPVVVARRSRDGTIICCSGGVVGEQRLVFYHSAASMPVAVVDLSNEVGSAGRVTDIVWLPGMATQGVLVFAKHHTKASMEPLLHCCMTKHVSRVQCANFCLARLSAHADSVILPTAPLATGVRKCMATLHVKRPLYAVHDAETDTIRVVMDVMQDSDGHGTIVTEWHVSRPPSFSRRCAEFWRRIATLSDGQACHEIDELVTLLVSEAGTDGDVTGGWSALLRNVPQDMSAPLLCKRMFSSYPAVVRALLAESDVVCLNTCDIGLGKPTSLSCRRELLLLRQLVLEPTVAQGNISCLLDSASRIAASPLGGTWECAMVCDVALCGICSSRNGLSGYFIPSHTGAAPRNETIAQLLTFCSDALRKALCMEAIQNGRIQEMIDSLPGEQPPVVSKPSLAALEQQLETFVATVDSSKQGNGVLAAGCPALTIDEWKLLCAYVVLRRGGAAWEKLRVSLAGAFDSMKQDATAAALRESVDSLKLTALR